MNSFTKLFLGVLAISISALSERAQSIHADVEDLVVNDVIPAEKELSAHQSSSDKWKPHPLIEQFKVRRLTG